jgi:hypothetical protein
MHVSYRPHSLRELAALFARFVADQVTDLWHDADSAAAPSTIASSYAASTNAKPEVSARPPRRGRIERAIARTRWARRAGARAGAT